MAAHLILINTCSLSRSEVSGSDLSLALLALVVCTMQSHNDVQLNRTMLLDLLDDFQQRTLQEFGCQIRLFVHGGAVMILHPILSTSSTRRATRDIDYIGRAFGHEWRKKGVYDAEDRLQSCINETAYTFRIGCVSSVLRSNICAVLNVRQNRLDELRR